MKLILQAIKSMFRKEELNRPCYDTRQTEPIILTFDGNLEGKDVHYMFGNYSVKLSDEPITVEEAVGATMVGYNRGECESLTVSENEIAPVGETAFVIADTVLIALEDTEMNGILYKKGVWIPGSIEDGVSVFYVSSISYARQSETVTLTFDGNIKDAELVWFDCSCLVKISDEPIESQDIIGATEHSISFEPVDGDYIEHTYTNVIGENSWDWINGVAYNAGDYLLVTLEDTKVDGVPYSKGVWAYTFISQMDGADYLTSCTYNRTTGELKKLDEKYIPDSVTESIDDALNTANSALEALDAKMSMSNPTGTGSFSMHRRNGTVIGNYSHAEGMNAAASGAYSHAEGDSATASGLCSHAEGGSVTASGLCSHAEGGSTKATGRNSHAEGGSTEASGDYSHAEGGSTKATGNYSHAEGSSTKASGAYSHAEGYNTKATSTNDTASITSTTSKGYYSHAEGYGTVAYGSCSHAEGNGTKASGNYSHAEGNGTIASGDYSHAEGYGTTAPGLSSHAEGNDTMASGPYSHSEGLGTTAQRQSQHTQGEYNMIDTGGFARGKYAHIVGNGTSPTARSNAHTLDWNGLGWFAGGLKVGGTGQDDEAAVEVALKTDIPKNIIQSVNGVTPDANGNVVIEVSGGETVTDEHINKLIDAKLAAIPNAAEVAY